MAQPALRLPAHGPWAPPVLRLTQPFVLPQTFCPPGLQRAPCGCCFDPRVFRVQWTVPHDHQGTAAAPAPPVLPAPIPGYRHLEGQLARLTLSSKATAAGTPHSRAAGDPASHLAGPEKVLLEDALKLFGCLVDTEGPSKGDLSSVPKPDEPGDTGAVVPQWDLSSLALPEDLLTPDYSVPETRAAVLSMEQFYVLGLEPPELWDAAMEPPAAPAELRGHKRGHKRGHSPSPEPPSKRRGWVGGGN